MMSSSEWDDQEDRDGGVIGGHVTKLFEGERIVRKRRSRRKIKATHRQTDVTVVFVLKRIIVICFSACSLE
jgi:hypothetical protein